MNKKEYKQTWSIGVKPKARKMLNFISYRLNIRSLGECATIAIEDLYNKLNK